MAHRTSDYRPVLAAALALPALGLLATACGSGGATGNASPRISAIPQQVTTGGTALALDLSTYVIDRESDAVTFTVVSGGGSFAGSTYTNTFATMGSYTVTFDAADALGLASRGSFEVDVTSAHFAVVNEDTNGLLLLDTMTDQFVRVTSGAAPTFATGLADGRLVYQVGTGTGRQLWIFDPFTRTTRQIGTSALPSMTYRTRTSDGRIVLTTGTAPDTDLYVFNPRTNLLTEVSAVSGQTDGDAMVNGADLVFYERGNAGQNDIYYYDPETDTSVAVGTDANDEQLLATLPDNGVVFSRVGAGGEHDLFYFKVGTGVVEIGTNVSALATADKVYGGAGSQSQVVFTAANGVSTDLYFWSPSTGIATAIAQGATFGFEAIGAGDEVVYRTEISATEHDLLLYDLDDATTATVRNSTDIGSVLGVTTDGTTAWALVQGSALTTRVSAVSLVGAPTTVNFDGATATSLAEVLGNGDAIVTTAGGASLGRFDVSGGAFTTINGTGLTYGGAGIDAGDFVYSLTAAAQTDLSMWDDSGTASVVVSNTTGNDVFRSRTNDGTLLFTRVTAPDTNADLWVWHPVDGETQLTTEDSAGRHDHSVAAIYDAAR
ncbi:MAG: hypothetical protein AB7O97_08285 [Planctomycetota bacterium]